MQNKLELILSFQFQYMRKNLLLLTIILFVNKSFAGKIVAIVGFFAMPDNYHSLYACILFLRKAVITGEGD